MMYAIVQYWSDGKVFPVRLDCPERDRVRAVDWMKRGASEGEDWRAVARIGEP